MSGKEPFHDPENRADECAGRQERRLTNAEVPRSESAEVAATSPRWSQRASAPSTTSRGKQPHIEGLTGADRWPVRSPTQCPQSQPPATTHGPESRPSLSQDLKQTLRQ